MNSVIISFFIKFFSSVAVWFNHSLFNKLQEFVSILWTRVTKNSFLVNLFKTYPSDDGGLKNSFLGKVINFIFSLIRKPVLWGYSILSKGVIFTSLSLWYKNFFNMSVKGYSIFVFGFCLVNVASVPFGYSQGKIISLLYIVLMIVSLFGMFLNMSLGNLLSGSVIKNILSAFFGESISFSENTLLCSLTYLICHLIVGLILGALTVVSGLIIPVLFIALLCMGLVLKDYRVGVYTAVILMPFLPTMAVVGLVLFSAASFFIKLCVDKEFSFVHTSLDALFLIFAFIMLISTLSSFAMVNSLKIYMVYFVFLISYYLLVNAIATKGQLYFVIKMMLLGGVLVSLYGIYQHIFGFDGGTTWTDTEMFEDIATRVVSTFGNPNVLGEYLLLLIPVCAGYILSEKKFYNKSAFLVITGLLSLCMVFTYSRGNWIGLIVAMALFFMFYDRRVVWLGVIAVLFLPVLLPETIIDRFLSVGNTSDSSTSYRVNIWMGTVAMLKDYWISGVGLGTEAFNEVYPYYSFHGIVAPHSHNLYLQLVVENGITGLVAFVILILTYYRMCISSIVRNKKDRLLKATTIGLSAGMFGYLVQGMFDNVWYNYRIVFMFYVIIALTVSSVKIYQREEICND